LTQNYLDHPRIRIGDGPLYRPIYAITEDPVDFSIHTSSTSLKCMLGKQHPSPASCLMLVPVLIFIRIFY
jgi:hypothetical protein